MGNVDESRAAKAVVILLACSVTAFCGWLLFVYAPTLTVPASERELDSEAASPELPEPLASPNSPTVAAATLAVLGDTFTAGARASGPVETWPVQVCEVAGCEYDPRFAEAGSGFVARGVDGTRLGEQADALIAARPDVVVVAGGAYDKGAPRDLLQRRISTLLDRLKEGLPNSRIVVFSPFWRTTPIPPEIRVMREVIRAEALAKSLDFVDVTEIFESPGNELVTDDGLPTTQGHAEIAAMVGQAVADNLAQAEGYPGG